MINYEKKIIKRWNENTYYINNLQTTRGTVAFFWQRKGQVHPAFHFLYHADRFPISAHSKDYVKSCLGNGIAVWKMCLKYRILKPYHNAHKKSIKDAKKLLCALGE
jgi:hypothetical protein